MGKISKSLSVLVFLFASKSLLALTTLHVTLSSDDNPGGMGDAGDLRYALNTMNQNLNTAPDDHAIIFDFPMTIQLNGILPIINNSSNTVNITIGNSGSTPTVTIDGNSGAYRGFFIAMGNVTIQNMVFQNVTAQGGNGGDGISGGGGGLGAGGAIFAPQNFLNGSNPQITLKNVTVNNSSAVGGNGGNYFSIGSPTGNEGGGGGGGFCGTGGSITTTGSTGGGGGGGFGGNGGDVTVSTGDVHGGGGGGGGGIGSRANVGPFNNLGNGGSDQQAGQDGSAYGLSITAGSGGAGYSGGTNAGGGGGGGSPDGMIASGGGGGGSSGSNGLQAQGSTPPLVGGTPTPSGGNGGDGAGGGGAGIVAMNTTNNVDGTAGSGGYAGGGGGGAGVGAYDTDYNVKGGTAGIGGGGGGGGVNQSGVTPSTGGDSQGGGGGGGAGPSNGISSASGGSDLGHLGGGAGGSGANQYGAGFGGGGGGGGSGLGGAIFVDASLNFTIEAFSGVPTTFNTTNSTVTAGTGGDAGSSGGTDGTNGTALGNSIFLREGSSLTFTADDVNDLLTVGDQVSFVDDTTLGGNGTSVFVRGDGTVIYNGTTNYEGSVTVNNANFKVNGQIDNATVMICRNSGASAQPGKLSGNGTMTGDVYVNTGTISPEAGETISLGTLTLNPPSTVHIEMDENGTSLVAVTGNAALEGTLDINISPLTAPGTYNVLTAGSIFGTFDAVTFSGTITSPNYTLSYLPVGAPTYVQFNLIDNGLTSGGGSDSSGGEDTVTAGRPGFFAGCGAAITPVNANSPIILAFLLVAFSGLLILIRFRV